MNRLHTTTFKLLSALIMSLPVLAFADLAALKKMENDLVSKYKDAPFYEINHDVEDVVSSALAQDPASFSYDFPKLSEHGFVNIKYSPDKKLKFYNFNVGYGGSMGEASNYVQYHIGQNTKFDEFETGFHTSNVQQVKIQNKVVYLVQSYYKGDNCSGAYDIRAVEMGKKQLLKAYVFKSKNQTNHDISVDFSCRHYNNAQDSPDYFRIGPTTVDVMLLDQNDVPQHKYLRYQLGKTGYVYSGVVK